MPDRAANTTAGGSGNGDGVYWDGGPAALAPVFEAFRTAYGEEIGFSIHRAKYWRAFSEQK